MSGATYPAIWNGHHVTAKRHKSGRWLIGGDWPHPGDAISILSAKHGRPAWFTLRGCFLVFSDFAAQAEIETHLPGSEISG
jgi:hypothetical protein